VGLHKAIFNQQEIDFNGLIEPAKASSLIESAFQ